MPESFLTAGPLVLNLATIGPGAPPRQGSRLPELQIVRSHRRLCFEAARVPSSALDVPIKAVVGGLHLPVHPAGTPLVPQAIIANPHPPWQPISERDAEHVLDEIQARGPQIIALSGHDSTPWTYDAFTRRFGDRYRTLRAGEELRITATAGS